jgi:SAM-dependent methyltransferase
MRYSQFSRIMSGTFNVNEYWLKRGRDYIAENFPAEYHRLQEQFLLDTLRRAGIAYRRILDLGCGFGRITRLLATEFPEATITAVDLSQEQLANARHYCEGQANVEFAPYDFYSRQPPPGGHHDLIVAVEVFLHHPGSFLRQLLQRLATACQYLVNIDWSEDWPWPRPEHVWVHDYSVLYREVGLENAALPLPERIDGLQQKLFFAGRVLPEPIRAFCQSSLAPPVSPPPSIDWYVRLQQAVADIRLFVPENASLILINDNQWSLAESELRPRQILPFLEHDGQYWGAPPDDATAIAELTRMQQTGATHVAIPWHCFWWLEHFTGFDGYLRHSCKCLLANDRVIIFQLNP